LKGPGQANRLKTRWTVGTELRTYKTATTKKHRPRWAHKGSTDPIGRPNQPCVGSSQPSTWCFLVDSWSIPGVFTPFSRSYPRPINRCEGTHFLPNSLSNSSLTFGFQG
jgi:hypothetical protein